MENTSASPQVAITPYDPSAGRAPVYVPNGTATPSTDQQALVVQIGDRELPLSQVETLVRNGLDAQETLERANALLDRNETAQSLATILDALSEENQFAMRDALEYVVECQKKGVAATSVDEILNARGPRLDLPANYVRTPFSQMDENPEGRFDALTVHEYHIAENARLRQEIKGLTTLVAQLHQHVESVIHQSQRLSVAQICSQKLGIDVTPQMLAEWAQGGITDPVKAIDQGFIKASGTQERETVADAGRRVVSAPIGGGSSKVIPPTASLEEADRLWAQGAKFDTSTPEGASADKSYRDVRQIPVGN